MASINPVIIISEQNDQCDAIDQLFTSYSIYELLPDIISKKPDYIFNKDNDRWWVFLDAPIQNPIDNKLLPVLRNQYGVYSINSYVFIYYKSFNEFSTKEEVLSVIQSANGETIKMSGSVSFRLFFVFRFKNSDEELFNYLNNFENIEGKIIFLSDSNYCNDNLTGYMNIDEKDLLAQTCQLMFFLGIPGNAGHLLSQLDIHKCLKASSIGLSFELDVLRKNYAQNLSYHTLYDFINSKEWVDNSTVRDDTLIDLNKIEDVYSRIKHNQLDIIHSINNILAPPPINPWHLIKSTLVPQYYEIFIRTLPNRISEQGKTLGNMVINTLEIILSDNRKKEEQNFKNTIWEKLLNDFRLRNKRGLEHYRKKIINYKDKFTTLEQECSIEAEKVKDLFINKRPISSLPRYILQFENDFASEISNQPDDTINRQRGKEILKSLKKKLEFHPIALSLFFRALILGILLMVIGITVMIAFPDFIINTSVLESVKSKNLTMAILFFLPLVLTFFYFWISVVRIIKKLRQKYVAWIIHTVQRKLFNKAIEETKAYYHSCINICNELITQIDQKRDFFTESNKPEKVYSPVPNLFPANYFFEIPDFDKLNFKWSFGEFLEADCFEKFKLEKVNETNDWFKKFLNLDEQEIKSHCYNLGLHEYVLNNLDSEQTMEGYFRENWLEDNLLKPRLKSKLYPSFVSHAGGSSVKTLSCLPQDIKNENINAFNSFLLYLHYIDS